MATRIALFFVSFLLVAATAGASQTISAQKWDQIVVAQSEQSAQTDKSAQPEQPAQPDQSTQSPEAKKTKKKGKKKSAGAGEDDEPECD